jgi:hypothetical protein
MQPHNPSRRGLLGGILAGLFGWLSFARRKWVKPRWLLSEMSNGKWHTPCKEKGMQGKGEASRCNPEYVCESAVLSR